MRSWWWVKEKKKHMDLLITVAMILQFQMKGCVGCVETERMGLLQLKSYSSSLPGFGEGEGSNLNSWSDDDGPNSDCCNWEGVKCSDATGGHIVDLSLDSIFDYLELDQTDRGLNISLLHSFPQLKTLVLNNNCFSHLFDPIHGYKSFERLENLESLDLSSNRFNSSVLPFLSAAKSLRILNLGSNRLEGVFPPNGYKSFQTLENLESLDLSRNNFNISVLSFLSAAKSLRILRLARNSLEGVFPPNGYKSFQRLENLEDLDLSGNRFNNSVLPFLSAARSLWFLNLGGNRLEGVFPPNPNGLNNFRELEELYLSDNAIKDFEAGKGLRKTKLKTLDLRYNRLSETARLKGLEHLVELEFLSLSSNQLNNTRSIQVLKDMPKLQELDLSYNEFTDLDSLGYSKLCGLINLRELGFKKQCFDKYA
ncbi:unnamed protein product [Microthlaspi erraticum]|uniref:Leucine-rich repeat-containing N-terminal plant-type domain-containing protein n=1 Tax=Microthlaspi erraticum TaxID=1685480 RepID=A0A6D2HD61_9BRAS|nr:unnamed protein product [Microthlaspi erraticum]